MRDSPDNGKTARVSGNPNKDQLDKAKRKYTAFTASAVTKYDRLVVVNQKRLLNPNTESLLLLIHFSMQFSTIYAIFEGKVNLVW